MSATTMGTTNIFDLEIDKQTVVQQQQQQQPHQQQQQHPQQQQQNNNYMDPSTINELVNGIEQLRQSGLTSIPTRDIPNHTERNVIDQETLSTYVPQTKRDKAQAQPLNDEDDYDDANQGSMKVKSFSIEGVYEDIQMPIFVGILYFLFQLPIFKKYLFYFFPNLIGLDGNYNLAGYSFTSILFALLYYLINVAVKSF